ncbi:MAG: hypothetical protein H6P99_1488 [Holophagaceae bacterium]|nr:hypothetical protein [Holophagaceae bacterium]
MRTILRAILAVALLLGGGAGDWTLAQVAQGHEACCCGPAMGAEDACPCPKPEGSQTPSRSQCAPRASEAAVVAERRAQGARKVEPRPEPAAWAEATPVAVDATGYRAPSGGRDPDLGRHLARLETHRI